ncbi:hypothetical protein KDK95_12275 [Actinospica sp. MGRD01-02]|uniref:Uncharacterized protein n=1 Tax=Actinospica acidithermotolerans TaxID=2828514 RepID=A0A941IG61_9ACTN|nr:hypothetical protein [Actinospica acidithermotolerans]MBR7827085.1 hypothetical protein [Actinospica acidithermotolerans]
MQILIGHEGLDDHLGVLRFEMPPRPQVEGDLVKVFVDLGRRVEVQSQRKHARILAG